MFVRTYNSTDIEKRQNRKFIELSSNGKYVPLAENWSNRWCRVPENFLTNSMIYRDIYEFQVLSDDVFGISYPKSGTTMILLIIWLLKNDLDYETVTNDTSVKRLAFLEYV